MQNLVSIYEENSKLIQKFIVSSLKRMHMNGFDEKVAEHLFSIFPNLELLYECDERFVQISENLSPSGRDKKKIGMDRSYLVDETAFTNEVYFHDPYISAATGNLCMTVVYRTKNGYLFLDFRLRGLLERFDLIENEGGFRRLNRYAYALIGGGLLFFALFVILYGFYSFAAHLFGDEALNLEMVFKPVIALTLGLAVYDLGKTIVEQEVLPRTHKVSRFFNAGTLMNFSVSIIIALLIEALLVVFKISISDYRDLPFAAGLIAALAFLLLVFALFVYLVRKSGASAVEMHADTPQR